MRRVADLPMEYLVAGVLALAIAVALFLLHNSSSKPVTTASAPPAAVHTPAAPAAAHAPAAPAAGHAPAAPANSQSALELLARSQRAYAHVPGVSMAAHIGTASMNFAIVLRHDQIVAESFIGGPPGELSQLVAPNGPTTYGRAPHSACWALVSASSPQALDDLSHPFPYVQPNVRLLAPERVAGGWVVTGEYEGQTESLVIDGQTYLVRSLSSHQGTMAVRSLASAPRLPVPEPRCS